MRRVSSQVKGHRQEERARYGRVRDLPDLEGAHQRLRARGEVQGDLRQRDAKIGVDGKGTKEEYYGPYLRSTTSYSGARFQVGALIR